MRLPALAALVLVAVVGCASTETDQQAETCSDVRGWVSIYLDDAREADRKAHPYYGQEYVRRRDDLIARASRKIVNNPDCFTNSDVLEAKRYLGYLE